MEFTYKNQGTCSRQTIVNLNEDKTIESIAIIGGCDGNLKGITALLKGLNAEDAIKRLEGIKCGFKNTSCPDQVAKALRAALEKM